MENNWTPQIEKHGFWYVDIPRTSSSSIKVELGRQYGLPYGKSNVLEQEHRTRQGIEDHIPALHMRNFLGHNLWDRLFTFTFVRNPWDRQVSMYFYRLRKGHFGKELTFRDYILRLKDAFTGSRSALFRHHAFYLACSDYILDEKNHCLIDFIGKFETRESDIQTISRKIGCPGLGALLIQAAGRDKEHYSRYYDNETIKIVAQLYQKDISMFAYKFEHPGI